MNLDSILYYFFLFHWYACSQSFSYEYCRTNFKCLFYLNSQLPHFNNKSPIINFNYFHSILMLIFLFGLNPVQFLVFRYNRLDRYRHRRRRPNPRRQRSRRRRRRRGRRLLRLLLLLLPLLLLQHAKLLLLVQLLVKVLDNVANPSFATSEIIWF